MIARLVLFGTPHVVATDGKAVELRRHAIALLARLSSAGSRGVPRDALHALLWPESDATRAQNSLRQAVFHIRQRVGDGVISGTTTLRLDPAFIWSDRLEIEDKLEGGDDAAIVALHGGPFLDGFHLRGSPEFDRWADAERSRLSAAFLASAQRLTEALMRARRPVEAADVLARASAMAPYDSRIAGRLIEATLAAGQPALALQRAESHLTLISADLELPPDPEIQALIERLRTPGEVRISPVRVPAVVEEAPPLPEPTPVSPGTPPVRSRWWMAATAGIVVAIAALALRAGRTEARDARRLVVAPFTVAGPDSVQYLGAGAAQLVASGLDAFRGRQVVAPAAVLSFLHSTSDAKDPSEIARHFGAGELVTGEIVVQGDSVSIRATLHARTATDSVLGVSEVRGLTSDVMRLADRVSTELIAFTGSVRNPDLARRAITNTKSLEAYKAFLEGEQAMVEWRFTDAVRAYERAVAIDSTFALAYFRLSIAADWAPNAVVTKDAAKRALHLADRLGEHERMLVASMEAFRSDRFDEAETSARYIVRMWPTDIDAWFHLGEILFHTNAVRGRPFEDAAGPFERVHALDPHNREALTHLARIAGWKGDRRLADSLVRLALAQMPDSVSLDARVFRAFVSRDSADEERVLRELRPMPELALWNECNRVAVFTHDLDAAARVCELLLEPNRSPESHALGRYLRAYLAIAGGSRTRARVELAAIPSAWRPWRLQLSAFMECLPAFPVDTPVVRAIRDSLALVSDAEAERIPPLILGSVTQTVPKAYELARASACIGDSTRAAAYRASIELSDTATRTMRRRALFALDAESAERAGRHAEALAYVERAASLADPAWDGQASVLMLRWIRATALTHLGRADEAHDWYGSFDGVQLFDLAFAADGHVARAEIARAKGRIEDAKRETAMAAALRR